MIALNNLKSKVKQLCSSFASNACLSPLISLFERPFHATVDHTESALAETRDGLHPRLKHGPFGKTMTRRRLPPALLLLKLVVTDPLTRQGRDLFHCTLGRISESRNLLRLWNHCQDFRTERIVVVHLDSCCATRGTCLTEPYGKALPDNWQYVGQRHSNHDSEADLLSELQLNRFNSKGCFLKDRPNSQIKA